MVLSHINLNVTTVLSCVNKYRSRLVVKLTGDVFDCVYFLSSRFIWFSSKSHFVTR